MPHSIQRGPNRFFDELVNRMATENYKQMCWKFFQILFICNTSTVKEIRKRKNQRKFPQDIFYVLKYVINIFILAPVKELSNRSIKNNDQRKMGTSFERHSWKLQVNTFVIIRFENCRSAFIWIFLAIISIWNNSSVPKHKNWWRSKYARGLMLTFICIHNASYC